jgi:hypothetical protein
MGTKNKYNNQTVSFISQKQIILGHPSSIKTGVVQKPLLARLSLRDWRHGCIMFEYTSRTMRAFL